MKLSNEYKWHGHNIKIKTSASPKFLWLDYKFDVLVDNKQVTPVKQHSLTQSETRFTINHKGHNLKARVVSTGFPFTPIVSQSTIVDDIIVGRSQMLISKRAFTYACLSAVAISFF